MVPAKPAERHESSKQSKGQATASTTASSSTACSAGFCIAALRDLKTASINIRRVVIIRYPAFPGNDERVIAVCGKSHMVLFRRGVGGYLLRAAYKAVGRELLSVKSFIVISAVAVPDDKGIVLSLIHI